jgi:hypothetical protein
MRHGGHLWRDAGVLLDLQGPDTAALRSDTTRLTAAVKSEVEYTVRFGDSRETQAVALNVAGMNVRSVE